MMKDYYPYACLPSVFAIDFQKLYDKGFRAVVFDIDNTLVHHGDDSTPEVDGLFAELHAMGFKTLLLTNNDEERVQRFNRNIGTAYICEAEKPAAAAYFRAVEMLGLPKEQVVFVGDQVFVDILGANRSGMTSILVHFIRQPGEIWLGAKRYIEKMILWFCRMDKRYCDRLGDIKK